MGTGGQGLSTRGNRLRRLGIERGLPHKSGTVPLGYNIGGPRELPKLFLGIFSNSPQKGSRLSVAAQGPGVYHTVLLLCLQAFASVRESRIAIPVTVVTFAHVSVRSASSHGMGLLGVAILVERSSV